MLDHLARILGALATVPDLACLVGHRGASIVWREEGEDDAPSEPRGTADHDRVGDTWAPVPSGANLVQFDYEWRGAGERGLSARHPLHLHPDGGIEGTAADRMRVAEGAPLASAHLIAGLAPLWSGAEHRRRIARILAYIAAGDCYQVNLAVPFTGRLQGGDHADLAAFLAVLHGSPAPFSACFRSAGRPTVLSHSPECLLSIRGEAMHSLPIKGTRRRIAGQEDAQRADLLAHPKDNAELAMIVDLVRNDLGRHARPGSVRVSDPAVLIDLDYVHHRAARIIATRAAPIADCFAAAFPAGSITGAPKIRAMEIIRDLEGRDRGAAYGAFGWIGADAADLAVAIRTASIAGSEVTFHAGGGIVADSVADSEWQEALAKASGFGRALGASC